MTAQTLYRLIYQRAPIKVAMKGMITTLDVCPGNLTFQGVVFLVKAILIRHKTNKLTKKNQKRKQMTKTKKQKNKKQKSKSKSKTKTKTTRKKQCF